ncbi:MAG: hypothetical protein IKA73_02440 [Alphaproteobacteria bacterium]|nr:hypothetical protein [Alphaproteobacteria bacterium]MBR2342295.1 hypothetical protein [Alphaproteobacteria bacterium]MBR2482650.1 hypothetical protein [Alphaproteobacteria bacterium]
MREPVQKLSTANITSETYTIAPSQIDYIAQIFGNTVADTMNMRTFAPKIRMIAERALRHALGAARTMGEKK